MIARYREQFDPEVMTAALDWFAAQVGRSEARQHAARLCRAVSRPSVIRGVETPQQWLAGTTEGMPHRAAALEELLLLWTANRNQAFRPSRSCLKTAPWRRRPSIARSRSSLPEYFATRPLIPLPKAKAGQPARPAACPGRRLASFPQRSARPHSHALEAAPRRQPRALP